MSETKDKTPKEPTIEELKAQLAEKEKEIAEHIEIEKELTDTIKSQQEVAKVKLPVIKIGNKNHVITVKKFNVGGTVYNAEDFKGPEAVKLAKELMEKGSEIFKPLK